MSIKKIKLLLMFVSLLILIVFVFIFRKETFTLIGRANDNLGSYKTQKLGTMFDPTDIPTVCNCSQCQVVIK